MIDECKEATVAAGNAKVLWAAGGRAIPIDRRRRPQNCAARTDGNVARHDAQAPAAPHTAWPHCPSLRLAATPCAPQGSAAGQKLQLGLTASPSAGSPPTPRLARGMRPRNQRGKPCLPPL